MLRYYFSVTGQLECLNHIVEVPLRRVINVSLHVFLACLELNVPVSLRDELVQSLSIENHVFLSILPE